MTIRLIVLLVLAVLFLTPLSRVVIAALFGKSIGKAALSKQPDNIQLTPTDPSKLRNAARVEAVAAEFRRAGFESAGLFIIPEMPGLSLQLLANRSESMGVAIYDHPVVGVFFDVFSRYTDGGSCTHTTAPATGLKRREDMRVFNCPGASPATLLERARRERSSAGLKSCTATTVGPEFVAAYAEQMAWMKQRGISRSEVVKVATRKVA